MTNVLPIDQGTLGTKAILVDGDGNVVSLSEQAVRPHNLSDGRVEQYSLGLPTSVVGAGHDEVLKSGVSIDVVAIASQGETALAWDPDTGQPLSNMIVQQGPAVRCHEYCL